MISKHIFIIALWIFVCMPKVAAKKNNPDLGLLSQLEGTWKLQTESDSSFEKWQKVNERIMEGCGFRISGGDTILSEFILLAQLGSEIFYMPKVSHNELPVAFKLVESDDGDFVFENQKHDFPQRIRYSLRNEDSMVVVVEMITGEKKREFKFHRLH